MSRKEIKIYQCDSPGQITETTADELWHIKYPVATSQFCIVKKHSVMWKTILPNFKGEVSLPYAYPEKSVKKKGYYGIDRDVWYYTPDEMCNFSEEEAQIYFNLLENRNEIEIIFIRATGQTDIIPNRYVLYGYDVTYPVGEVSDGFSIIGDCLFWGRWHGCDKEGTLFINEFKTLNEYGLFDSAQVAYDYMIKYLNQDFAETGDYCIYEVYGR